MTYIKLNQQIIVGVPLVGTQLNAIRILKTSTRKPHQFGKTPFLPRRGAPCGYLTHHHANIGKLTKQNISKTPLGSLGQPQGIAPTLNLNNNTKQIISSQPRRGAPCGYPTHHHANIGKLTKQNTLKTSSGSLGQPRGIAPTVMGL